MSSSMADHLTLASTCSNPGLDEANTTPIHHSYLQLQHHQISSPPTSSSSPSPSPSTSTSTAASVAHRSSSSAISSMAATPLQQCTSAHSSKARGISTFDMTRTDSTPTVTGYFTPRASGSSSSCSIFEDDTFQSQRLEGSHRPHQQQSMSESVISLSTLAEIPKRRAAETPIRRQRSHTYARDRPQSMLILPRTQEPRRILGTLEINPEQDFLPSFHYHPQEDQSISSRPALAPRLHSESSSHHLFQSNASATPSAPSFWDDSEDVQEMATYKRPKNELRGVAGRRSRGAAWTRQKTVLRRRSTNSMIAGICLSNDQDEEDQADSRQAEDGENTRSTLFEDEESPFRFEPVRSTSGARRSPLTDISPVPPPPIVFTTKPLAPLMTRQPRKAPTRPRLVVVDDFPVNPAYWNEYAIDTLNYLLEIEGRYDRFMYFTAQPNIQPHMRLVLVQWLTELCYGLFRFETVTLHSAVNLLDRYITARQLDLIQTDQLQCIGVCALMTAGKLEENAIKFSTEELSTLCENAYTSQEIARMELNLLVVLKFEVLVASASGFADYFKRAIAPNPLATTLIDFLCDLSLVSHEFLDYNQSQIAASSIWIALCATNRDWNEELAILTGYSRVDLTPCSQIFKHLVCLATESLDLRSMGLKYPVEDILPILTQVLQ